MTKQEIEEYIEHDGLFGKFDKLETDRMMFDELKADRTGVLKAICTVTFGYEKHSDAVRMVIYENGTYKICSSACGQSFLIIAAYSRAHRFIVDIGLVEFSR